MTDLKIDQDLIDYVIYKALKLSEMLKKDAKFLRDESNDFGERYIHLSVLATTIPVIEAAFGAWRFAFQTGFDAHHENFQSDRMAEMGWSKITIEDNPIYDNVDDDENDSNGINIMKVKADELPKEVLEAFKKIMGKHAK